MNSIDNLREYVLTAPSICSTTRAILVGYIDKVEHEVGDMVPLPVDADGVPIRAGDVLDGYGKTIEVVDVHSGWVILSRDGNAYVDTYAFVHHHAPTVEDVLREFVERLEEIGSEDDCVGVDEQQCRACIRRDIAAAYAEYAAKLRLAGDE